MRASNCAPTNHRVCPQDASVYFLTSSEPILNCTDDGLEITLLVRTGHRAAFEKAFGQRLIGDEIEFGGKSALLGAHFLHHLGLLMLWRWLVLKCHHGCDLVGAGNVVVGGHELLFLAESEERRTYTTFAPESTTTSTTTPLSAIDDGTIAHAGAIIVGACLMTLFL